MEFDSPIISLIEMVRERVSPKLSRREFLRLSKEIPKFALASRFMEMAGVSPETLESGIEYVSNPEEELYERQTVIGYDVATNPSTNESLIAWADTFHGKIAAKILSPQGNPSAGEILVFPHSDMGNVLARPELSFLSNEQEYAIVMNGIRKDTSKTMFAVQRLQLDGKMYDPPLPLFDANLINYFGVSYNSMKSQMLIVWREGWEKGLRGKIVDLAGNVVGEVPQIPKIWSYSLLDRIAITYDPARNRYLLSWIESPELGNNRDLVAKYVEINNDGSFSGEPVTIDSGYIGGTTFCMGNEGKIYIVWSSYDLQVGELTSTGIANKTLIDYNPLGVITEPSIIFDGSKFLISYEKIVAASGTGGLLSVHQIHSRVLGSDLSPVSSVISHNLPIFGENHYQPRSIVTIGKDPFLVVNRYPKNRELEGLAFLRSNSISQVEIYKQFLPSVTRERFGGHSGGAKSPKSNM